MKNAARRNRLKLRLHARAPLLGLAGTAWFVALTLAPSYADDAEHWLVPSRHSVQTGTLFESGVTLSAPAAQPVSPTAVQQGAVLYATHCATCHGADLAGTRGVPSLQNAGGAATDFYLSTGRMPLADRALSAAAGNPAGPITAAGTQADHRAPLFDAQQIAALDAYITQRARHAIPIPSVALDATRLQRGRMLFEDNCEACHGAAAQGATAGFGWIALPLDRATPTQIGEAVRIGPGVMPRFTPVQLPDRDLAAVATYVRYLATEPQDYGGTVMAYVGPSAEGAVGAFLGVGLLFWVVYFTGTKADGRRFHELDEPDR